MRHEEMEKTENIINSKILKSCDTNWRELKFLQQDDFKALSEPDAQTLRTSLVFNQFVQPFYVWQAPDGTIYCLDGHHRVLMLDDISRNGYKGENGLVQVNVPDMLPAIFIDCKDKVEAAKMVLIFSSAYAKITDEGLRDFISIFDLPIEEIALQVNIPDLNLFTLYGDIDRDFSNANQELDIETFTDEIVLKLKYSKNDYLFIKQRIAALMEERKLTSPEELIKELLK